MARCRLSFRSRLVNESLVHLGVYLMVLSDFIDEATKALPAP